MQKRSLFLTLAAVLVWGFGALEARAGSLVPLPATLDNFVGANYGNYAVVAPLTFTDFTYIPSAIPSSTPTLPASGVTVSPFSAGAETGITLSGDLVAGAGTSTDYAISYTVSSSAPITDATLIGAIATTGTGSGTIIETLIDKNTGKLLGTLEVTSGGIVSDTISGFSSTSILVEKDISLVGGTGSASVSIIDQGFSSVPEPHSMALLGIGLSSFFTFRRFLKKRAGVA